MRAKCTHALLGLRTHAENASPVEFIQGRTSAAVRGRLGVLISSPSFFRTKSTSDAEVIAARRDARRPEQLLVLAHVERRAAELVRLELARAEVVFVNSYTILGSRCRIGAMSQPWQRPWQ